ncbi:DMT family transporter [Aquabacter sp. L1I39]|uniref:DMT family transporter n=1 Tax=Aquabacter sp. L1I39 TaxID=2820278 RepID=UPI001ADAC5D7|nr:DMT family transporter [Aquabacter sp. L1I39]QTL02988.1 DMT family transporter [Aquabacter sp. L1I39]
MSASLPFRILRRLTDAPYVLLSATAFLWAANMVLGRYVAGHIPPITLSTLRWSGATLILLPFAWRQLVADAPVIRRSLPALVMLAAAGIASYNALSYYGLQYTEALHGVLLQSVSPLLIAVWSLMLFKDRITRGQGIGILVSFVGVIIIISRGDLDVLVHLQPNVGDLWILFALVIYALYAAILRLRPPMRQLSFLATIMALGSLMLMPFALWEAAAGHHLIWDSLTIWTLLFVMTGPSLVAYLFFNRGVELVGANRAAPFFHLMPVFGSVLAVLFLGEAFEWYHGLGYALVLAGIFTATRSAKGGKKGGEKGAQVEKTPGPGPGRQD